MGYTALRPRIYRILAVVALFGVTTLYLNGTHVLLPDSRLSSYLGDYQFRSTSAWQVGLFGNRTRWNSMDHFTRLRGEYDYQKNYGLLDIYSEAKYQRAFTNLADDALSEFMSFHMNTAKKSAGSGLSRAIHLDRLKFDHTTLVYAGIAAAVYTGRTLRYSLSDDISLESQTLIRSARKQYLGWASASLGVSGGGTYDAAAGQMNYSVQKSISSNVHMNYEKSADHSVGVSYSTGF